jgi:hypothetical protein
MPIDQTREERVTTRVDHARALWPSELAGLADRDHSSTHGYHFGTVDEAGGCPESRVSDDQGRTITWAVVRCE